jgi:hypothetical protein
MRIRFFPWTTGLVTVLVLIACSPAPLDAPAAEPVIVPTQTASQGSTPTPEIVSYLPTPTIEVLPAATSRGPDLEATDPATVSLASGQLQLVEFFRFT